MTASLYQTRFLNAITNFPYCEFPVTSLDLKEILLLCEVPALAATHGAGEDGSPPGTVLPRKAKPS
jgi:hypothetical protein